MAGNYVYPGGTVDKSDESPEILTRVASGAGKGSHAGVAAPANLPGYRVAAIRELFEEAGILLAYDTDGALFRIKNESEQERFSEHRNKLNARKLTMVELLAEEHLLLAFDQLHYYTHWITPEANPVRFDTRFFVARNPSGQVATPDLKETTEGTWVAPRSALEANVRGDVPLSPPTLKTLEDIGRFDTLDSLLRSLDGAEGKPPVQPVSVVLGGETVLIYPWDPDYELYRSTDPDRYPKEITHGRPSTPSDNTTRLVYRQGLWLPFVK